MGGINKATTRQPLEVEVKKEKNSIASISVTDSVKRAGRGRGTRQGFQHLNVIESPMLQAMYPAYPSASYLAGLGSEETIPTLRGLIWIIFTTGDTLMSDTDSVWGKRAAGQQECESEERFRAVVLVEEVTSENKQKKDHCNLTEGNIEGKKDDMEATSHGAAGQLTGSQAATR
jgi:hypothetical protein